MKKLGNKKVTVIPRVISALDTDTKGLIPGMEGKEIRGRKETLPSTSLLISARILKRVMVSWGDMLSLKLQ